jgi:hypothetical protein
VRAQRGGYFAHVLWLDCEHYAVSRAIFGIEPLKRWNRVLPGKAGACSRVNFDHAQIGDRMAPLEQAANDRAGHIAAADERNDHDPHLFDESVNNVPILGDLPQASAFM